MKFSYRWLRDYLQVSRTIKEISEGFTMSGLEVESFIDMGALSGKIVVGRIQETRLHPDAANLTLCSVDIGTGRMLNIVCGAKNMKKGDRVAVALEGASLANGVTIRPTRIRGEVSEGMICAGDELGLNDDHSGVLILPEDLPVGEPFDAIFEIAVTPNRGDCLSLTGLARDLAASLGGHLMLPTIRLMETMDRIDNYLKVTVENKEDCPRYGARFIRGVQVGPSPAWLVYRLESAGLRSINNVIDATNYIMLETGQPIHAFDMDRVANRHIIVRSARNGETIETLDGERLSLSTEDLLITDPREPIALAGIMGGKNSGIVNSTINVVIECAFFNPVAIRKTSRRLGKQTDASFRFEREVDREAIPRVLDRVTSLIVKISGGEVVQGMLDIKSFRSVKKTINLPFDKTNQVLGLNLNPREIADLLVGLDFEITGSDSESITFSIPSHRADIQRDIDLIEEVARIHGYGKVKPVLPYLPACPNTPMLIELAREKAAETLSALGFDEAISYSFTSSRLTQALGYSIEHAVKIANPISPNQDIMRTSLLPGLMEAFAHNMNHGILDIALYESGKVFTNNNEGVLEEIFLIAGICGDRPSSWQGKGAPADFYYIKGTADIILRALGFSMMKIESVKASPQYHPGRAARYMLNSTELCCFGEMHPIMADRLEMKRRVYLLEMNLSRILTLPRTPDKFAPLPKYPAVSRDLAVVLDDTISAGDIEAVIRDVSGEELESVGIFDLYKGDPVPQGKKSLAYSFVFRAQDRTLTDAEVNRHMSAILAVLTERFQAILR